MTDYQYKPHQYQPQVSAPVRQTFEIYLQPDGTLVRLRLTGNDRLNWLETETGHTVRHLEDGSLAYVEAVQEGKLVASRYQVGKTNPLEHGIPPQLLPYESDETAIDDLKESEADSISNEGLLPRPVGNFQNLVVLARFSNHTSRTLPDAADYELIFNQSGGDSTVAPTGSVKDVFTENSYGVCQPDSKIVDWVTLPESESYYSEGRWGRGPLKRLQLAIQQALDLIDSTTDFTTLDSNGDGFVDCVTFVHSGYGTEAGGVDPSGVGIYDRIWSRFVSLDPPWVSTTGKKVNRIAVCAGLFGNAGGEPIRIGLLSHEIGHVLGLPDLYDNIPYAGQPPGRGIGNWGIMGNCWGFDGSLFYPPHFSSYSKIFLGWITPTEITHAGTYSIQAVEQHPHVYKISLNYPEGEYLLIENRQPLGFDQLIPHASDGCGGLAIWHIDENQPELLNRAGYPGSLDWPKYHYNVGLLQADGLFDLEKGLNKGDGTDLYRSTLQDEIGPATVPATNGFQNGLLVTSPITLKNISASATTMTFEVEISS